MIDAISILLGFTVDKYADQIPYSDLHPWPLLSPESGPADCDLVDSHSRGQYPDGLRGQFVVHDVENPYRGQYDEEVALTVSDWVSFTREVDSTLFD
jgi:hypothetical protein